MSFHHQLQQTYPEQPAIHEMEHSTEQHGHVSGSGPHHPHGHRQVEHEHEPVHHQVISLRDRQEVSVDGNKNIAFTVKA